MYYFLCWAIWEKKIFFHNVDSCIFKDLLYSNKAIVKVLVEALKSVNLPEDCIQLVEDTSREVATEMMRLNQYIDVLIPRGGAGLIKAVVNNATVPVIETGTGNCHIYVDEEYMEIDFDGKYCRKDIGL